MITKTYKERINMWEVSTDQEHILHFKNDKNYTPFRTAMIKPEMLDNIEEIALEDVPKYTEDEYNAKVAELIEARYSSSKETALINNMLEENPTEEHIAEYKEYQAYRAECKERAKEILSAPKEEEVIEEVVEEETIE